MSTQLLPFESPQPEDLEMHVHDTVEAEVSLASDQAEPVPTGRHQKLGRFSIRQLLHRRGNTAPDATSDETPVIQQGQDQIELGHNQQETVDETRYREILESPLLQELPENERAEVASQTFELYKASKEVVAPVITGFADYLLNEAGDRQIVFAARDGLGALTAAKQLKEKFDYGNSDPDQLVYAYLTRKIVYGTDNQVLARYMDQLGIHDRNNGVILADIGMYGSIVPSIREVLPKVDVRYVISRSSSIPGYADGQNSHMKSIESIMGNPAIHFLEDTFSGSIPSPNQLVEEDGKLVPNTLHDSFPPAEALKREFAVKAIEDYAASLESRPKQPPTEAVSKLDAFLADPQQYKRLMVPHQR